MVAKISFLVAISFALFGSFHANAQYYGNSEFSKEIKGSTGLNFYVGGNTFLGDLGGNKGTGAPFIKDFNSKTIRHFLGVSYTYFPANWLSVNGGINFTKVTGADSLIKERQGHAAGRFERNLSFKSPITEVSAELEFYPLQTLWQFADSRFRPFISTGVGIFHFNPKAQLNGTWYNLHPLHLEGEGFTEYPDRKNYKLTQMYIPLSLGVNYRVSDNYFISFGAIFRKTFTDYIDDVSTTYIDPNLFDAYLAPADAKIAKQLYYRGTQYFAKPPLPYRGYGSADSYTSVFIGLTYLFNNSYTFHRP